MNNLAWLLATDCDDRLRNGAEAVKWAEGACEKDHWRDAEHLDTLAAACAEVERWEEAVATQKLAISNLTDESEKRKTAMESHLQQYLRHEKVRE